MPPKRSGLGRGLEALIPRTSDVTPHPFPPSEAKPETGGILLIPIHQIHPNPRQPRTHFEAEDLYELSLSICEHGIIQPLLVKRGDSDNSYVLIAGERRLQAARLAEFESVPVILREASDQDLIELALVENVQRADLSPLETAEAYRQLNEEFSLSHEDIAARVGKSRVSITNTLRLLKLPSSVQAALAEGKISEGHARALLTLHTPQAQAAALKTIFAKSLNVRQTEDLVRRLNGAEEDHPPPINKKELTPEMLDLQEKFRSRYHTKVDLSKSEKGGTIIFHYYSDEELDGLIQSFLG